MAVYPAGNEAFLTPNVITPQHYNVFAGRTQDAAIDTAALQWAITQAIAAGNGTVYLGSGDYLVNDSIGELIASPISIIGDGQAQCRIVMDVGMSGDLISFSDCWYGADVTNAAGGGSDAGSTGSSVSWPSRTSRKSGVVLRGFSVVGSRATTQTQNAIMFYDRNDAAIIKDIDIHFVKGHALMLSGKASNPAANAAFLMRESVVEDVHVRWCGDYTTGRIPVVLSGQDKGAASFDDNCNYNRVRNLKVVFPDGPGVALQAFGTNTNRAHHGNVLDIICDFPQNCSSAEVNSGFSSITNGVLTVAPGATITRALAVGQYLCNEAVPLATYIGSQLTGTPGGVGTYQLANNTLDISTLTVASGSLNALRPAMHFIQIGGGHVGEHWTIEGNASNTLGSGCGLVEFNHNVLDAATGKTRQSKLEVAIGKMDRGLVFTVINSLSVDISVRESVTSISALSVTQKVSVNVGQELFDARLAIGGVRDKIVVHCDGEQVVTSLPPPEKYPGAFFVLDTGSAYERYFSKASQNSATWELVT